MANLYVNKFVYFGETLFDTTGTTVDVSHLLSGITAVDRTGATITGTCTYDADTSDATAAQAEILYGKTAYVNGTKLTGTMTNRGKVTGTISTKAGTYTIPAGYHDGSGSVSIASSAVASLTASNILKGVTILGVTGTHEEESITVQSKTVTPTKDGFTVSPDDGYNYLTDVVVNAIPYVKSENAAGGYTITIGS